MQHSENDGELHLEAVEEDDLVVGQLPHGIKTERIHALGRGIGRQLQAGVVQNGAGVVVVHPTRSKYVH